MAHMRLISLCALLLIAAMTLHSAPQTPAGGTSRIDRLIAQMTLPEKLSMLHGARDPENLGQAGYLPGVPRLGIPPMRLTDGPAGVRTGKPATALPAPVALASTFSPALAEQYGQTIGRDGAALRQDVILAPMVNIVRVPQGGRNFETLGEDPFLASRIVAAEIKGIQSQGLIATVKHFAENNQENARQQVSADVDERTMHEIELQGFEAAVKAGVGSVMASYNKVNGTWASENTELQTKILRDQWGFTGFVMSDWGATHSGVPALTSGLELEMPSGANYSALGDAVASGALKEEIVDRAVRRILGQMDRMGWLDPARPARVAATIPATSPVARDIAIAGAVLLKNRDHVLPLAADDLAHLAVIGPTAKALLVGGGGSARVPPMHLGNVVDELRRRRANASIAYAVGYDLDGDLVPATALSIGSDDKVIDFTGANALAPGATRTWTGTITGPVTGNYELHLHSAGGRGSIVLDTAAPGAGRGGRGGGGAGLLPTALGLGNSTTMVHLDAGVPHPITVTATASAGTPMQIRLAWIPPGWQDAKIQEAVAAARAARTAVVFAYDEGQEGRDRASISLPGPQDALIAAIAAANPRTVVVLNNGAPIQMPWADRVAGILQMWYPGQEGADATATLLVGDASPGGKLPVTFPRQIDDAPTNVPERYPGVNGHGTYSEGIFVGYRWYDQHAIEPLFPFGHGLSYTDFTYSNLSAAKSGDGYDVRFTIKNTGARRGSDVPQVYVGPSDPAPAPMAARALAGFERLDLDAGQSRTVTIHLDMRAFSYWSVATHAWTVAGGTRTLYLGSSSRDIRLQTPLRIPSGE